MHFFHDGQRAVQAQFGTTQLADRVEAFTRHTTFMDSDRQFVESVPFFFLATADSEGRPDCSYKGGAPGFVRVLAPDLLAFPDYDGNGTFRSLGNLQVNAAVGLLFVRFGENPWRLRVNGEAALTFETALLAQFEGAQAVVEVRVRDIFPNCGRYVHDVEGGKLSKFTPRPGEPPMEADWKKLDAFKDVLPAKKP
jgi:predicted pyridoxine 5'-phosphate oxidase superfamily flavin-nucleotide-binding protein